MPTQPVRDEMKSVTSFGDDWRLSRSVRGRPADDDSFKLGNTPGSRYFDKIGPT